MKLQLFGNWICFCLQVEKFGEKTESLSVRPSFSPSLRPDSRKSPELGIIMLWYLWNLNQSKDIELIIEQTLLQKLTILNSRDILSLTWKLNVYHCIHKNLLLVPNSSQTDSVHTSKIIYKIQLFCHPPINAKMSQVVSSLHVLSLSA